MRKSVLILIAAVVIDLPASQSARAADIVPRGHPAPAPAPALVYAPPISWTGCYVGGNIGGAWSNVDLSGVSGASFSATNSGFAGGGQIGCDYQWKQFWGFSQSRSRWRSASYSVGFGKSGVTWNKNAPTILHRRPSAAFRRRARLQRAGACIIDPRPCLPVVISHNKARFLFLD